MKHPNPDKIRDFCGKLLSLGPQICNMEQPYVECGTPACHGGWASIVFMGWPDKDAYRFYAEGAKELANFLGFEGSSDLVDWAHKNPHLWGNKYGQFMFSSSLAFNQYCNTFPLHIIVSHWLDVAVRIEELEEENAH